MGIDSRLKRLEEVMSEYQGSQNFTVFVLEDGSSFTTRQDPLAYLVEHGTETPKGQIVSYSHPVAGIDALSLSIYDAINDEIKTGAFRALVEEMNG